MEEILNMNDKEYLKYLKEIEDQFFKFIDIAKKIKPSDKSEYMKSLKSKSVLIHIKLRAILQKFRRGSCGCNLPDES